MKKELELANYLARRLKSTLYRYICIVSMLLGGVQLSQSATASPLSTENKTAFEQNLIEAMYDFEEQRKRDEIEEEKTILLYDCNRKHE